MANEIVQSDQEKLTKLQLAEAEAKERDRLRQLQETARAETAALKRRYGRLA
jgi:hypothetical protein